MAKSLWSGDASRKIITRLIVEGDLVLQTPAHFGSGDTDELTDMPLLVDPLDGKTPLLTGASIAGALRSYLREREHGYGQSAHRQSHSVLLFGGLKGDDEGEQSPLIVEDALGKNFGIEMRDGVGLRSDSRTADEDKLFDLRLWQAGTTFPMRFELLIREGDDANALKRALAMALEGFNDGSITLGARKRRGYGRIKVTQWRLKTYDLTKPEDLLAWIQHGSESLPLSCVVSDLRTAFGLSTALGDARHRFTMQAAFTLDGSLLIRSGGGKDDTGPDMVHLRAKQAVGNVEPILSGTSLGGALRARALKIAHTLDTRGRAQALIEEMFGVEMKPNVQPKASRVIVREHMMQNARTDLVQSRVSIDRFTGGAREALLFSEQPAFGSNDTTVTVDVELINPKDYEIGLLLLLLKDLWTGDLPLGGESSVGRGRLKGKSATLTYSQGGTSQEWTIAVNGNVLTVKDKNGADARAVLGEYVTALNTELIGAKP